MNTTEQRIDDQDKSVDYSEPPLGLGKKDWLTNGGPRKYMNTASLTHKKGASAKLTFTGSSVAVYGIVSPLDNDSGTTSQYLIDGNTPTTYTTKPDKATQYDVKLFESDTLKAGQHTLEVVNETEDGWLEDTASPVRLAVRNFKLSFSLVVIGILVSLRSCFAGGAEQPRARALI